MFNKKAKLVSCVNHSSCTLKSSLPTLKPSRFERVRDLDFTKAKPIETKKRTLRSFFNPQTKPEVEVFLEREVFNHLSLPAVERTLDPFAEGLELETTYQLSIGKLRVPNRRPLLQLLLIQTLITKIRVSNRCLGLGRILGLSPIRKRHPPLIQLILEEDDIPIAFLHTPALKS